ncbi:MAG: dihydroorotase [Lachnospiraceae bacterium]|nr:dihydroorotase [Lachnospiraceae bacterium]
MAEGRIVKLSPAIDAGEGMEVIDGRGLMAAPGFVDVHVHFRDPGQTHKEDIFTGAKAAAKGGVTTVVLMANTVPAVDNEETLAYVLEKGRQTGINVLSCTTVTKGMKGEELCDLEGLKAAGAAGFTDDGKPIMNEALVREAMERAAALGLPISFHEEDPAFIDGPGFNRGAASEHFGIGGADRQAEISMIERDIKLALETGAVIDIQHISTKEGVELVRQARKKSGKIHAEATPHHFSLTEKDAIVHGVMAKMNPPLRTEEDRLAIIEGLKDGTIDMIATDHAPHAAAEKAKGIKEAPSGITGLETSFALGITKLVEPGYLSLETLIERMSCGPAEVYGLNTGVIREGGPADLVLFDPDEKWIFDDHASKSSNSPFAGSELKGRVKCTVWGGKVVYSNM